MKKHFAVIIVTALLFFSPSSTLSQPAAWLDSAASYYCSGAKNYDTLLLQKAVAIITGRPLAEQQSPKADLLLGSLFWRQALIAFCRNTPTPVDSYGKQAIEALARAQKGGADPYLAASYAALSCQLLASQGIRNGAVYGPRAAAELKKAQKANPQGYFSRLVEAINANQAPAFAGGNLKKAVVLLEKMKADFPDSIDVTIHLSNAYSKVGRREEARTLIEPILKTFPSNLLAQKVAAQLPESKP
jgi:tetratricopeptide (TPR) repeat protein